MIVSLAMGMPGKCGRGHQYYAIIFGSQAMIGELRQEMRWLAQDPLDDIAQEPSSSRDSRVAGQHCMSGADDSLE